jgi:hypothetical protein
VATAADAGADDDAADWIAAPLVVAPPRVTLIFAPGKKKPSMMSAAIRSTV